jgi:hypothetical protein
MYLKDYSEDEMMLAPANENGFDTDYNLLRCPHSFPELYNVNVVHIPGKRLWHTSTTRRA